MKRLPPHYWLALPLAVQLRHATMIIDMERAHAPFALDISTDKERACSCITFIGTDNAGLFARLAGACALANLSILEARIMTTLDGLAVDTLYVQPAAATSPAADIANNANSAIMDSAQKRNFQKIVRAVLDDRLAPSITATSKASSKARARRMAAFDFAPYVRLHNDLSDNASVIEVSALDRAALLYALVQCFFHLKITITAARIATFGERAVDVFYVQDLLGRKISGARATRITNILRDSAQMKNADLKNVAAPIKQAH